MNYLFLSPHFPPNYRFFCRALARRGARVLGMGDTAPSSLSADLRASLTDYYAVPTLEDYDKALRGAAYLTHRYGKLDRIESHNEHWLGLEARLRGDFNVQGPKEDSLLDGKLKSRMKARFLQAGLQVVQGERLLNAGHCRAFVERVGYPIVAKPDAGVGAVGARRIDDAAQLADFLKTEDLSSYFVEEFVEGTICTFDGLADRDAEPIFFTGHEYSSGVMEVLQSDGHVAYTSYRVIPEDIEAAGRQLLKVFDVRERFFHFEFFRRHRDQALIALEVNLRPPGGMTLDMFNFANDIDLYDGYAAMVMGGGTATISYHRPYHCSYISRKDHIRYRHSHEEVLGYLRPILRYEGPVIRLFSRGMGHRCYIIASPHQAQIDEAIRFVHATR